MEGIWSFGTKIPTHSSLQPWTWDTAIQAAHANALSMLARASSYAHFTPTLYLGEEDIF